MIKLKYGNVILDVYNGYQITKSSQDVTFNDLTCDFTNKTIDDLPEKYQESKLIEIDNFGNEKVLFFGYIEDYNFGEMRELDVETDINITLLSPMKMATLRTATAVGTYKLKDLIQNTILLPLIEDGFTISELEVTDRQITVNYLVETIEYCMNNLSNKFNFWWFIDEQKVIHIKDISKMFSGEPNHIYDKNHLISGLQYIKPSVNADNYANVINFKNVRIYETSRLTFNGNTIVESHNPIIDKQITTLKKDGQIDFNFPVDINQTNVEKSAESNGVMKGIECGIYISGIYSDNSTFTFYVGYNWNTGKFEMSNNVGYNGDTNKEKEFLLIRDSFFSNLITGFKFNNENKSIKSITEIKSDSVLIWNVNKMYNDRAIADKRDIISKTGIVEYTVDMKESWKTIQELQDIGASYMDKNSLKFDGTIEVLTDRNIFSVGETFFINKMLFNGTYIITQIQQTNLNNDNNYIVICKNANLLNSFIDVFRSEKEQENSDKTFKIYITHYNQDEITESHEVVQ